MPALSIGLLAPAADAGDGDDLPGPFFVTPEHFDERVHTIALMPVSIAEGIGDGDPEMSARLEARISAELTASGFEVIASEVYLSVWRDMAAQVGEIYDPRTGKRDADRYAAVRDHTIRELARRRDVNATLSTVLHVEYESSARRKVSGEMFTWMGEALRGHPQASRIARLEIHLWDTADRLLYGIWWDVAWLRVYFNQGYEGRSFAEVPGGSQKLDDALLRCLFFLTGGRWPSGDGPDERWLRRSAPG